MTIVSIVVAQGNRQFSRQRGSMIQPEIKSKSRIGCFMLYHSTVLTWAVEEPIATTSAVLVWSINLGTILSHYASQSHLLDTNWCLSFTLAFSKQLLVLILSRQNFLKNCRKKSCLIDFLECAKRQIFRHWGWNRWSIWRVEKAHFFDSFKTYPLDGSS